ncbi:MAG: GNAT family N-acetyltransferase [Paludibacteraceae bacterium]|nr:GNAT family N-acetyltransferase [Paludibacteraceae bacterium]
MIIEQPDAADRKEIERLWRTTFGDGDDFLIPYFSHLYEEKDCRVLRTDTCRVASFVHVIPMVLHARHHPFGNPDVQNRTFSDAALENQRSRTQIKKEGGCERSRFFSVGYVFGLMTHKDFRNRGLASLLLKTVMKEERNRGTDFLLLLPASLSLRSYYAQRGFRPVLFNSTVPVRSILTDTPYSEYRDFEMNSNENCLVISEKQYRTVMDCASREGLSSLSLYDDARAASSHSKDVIPRAMACCLNASENDFTLLEQAAGNLLMDV